SRLDIDGIFIYIGLTPNSKFAFDLIQTDEYGYIITNEEMETNIPGIYAVGDVRKKSLRQVVTACADGAIAASNAQKYIEKMKS
ncbi:MAG TPA: thioredoxin-disulfide reductase, partial [Desulfurella acetivorans]|nr:thioredoxin-disulfide reductase [Desulfurella acetivorans]